jgi:phosphatidylserine/phosphatidylglycerophosphate/cardiolipin synthase-like enzyme
MGAVLLSLVMGFVPAGAATPAGTATAAAPVSQAVRTAVDRAAWTPPTGALFNDPGVDRRRRVIVARVIDAIQAADRGSTIRIIVWNLDDKPSVTELIRAKERGVTVQVIASGIVDNPNWDRLTASFNRDTSDNTFARKCQGACRSAAKITHVKLFLFSKVNSATHVSMFGSTNLTTAAGNRQWNDLVTTRQHGLYDYWVSKFAQFAKDRAVSSPYEVRSFSPYRSTLFPAQPRNPVLDELKKVRCIGATGGTGNGAGRTSIRIAIAGWFDSYGQQIADRLRQMWDRGCDVKIVTTLAGRGVNQTMRQSYGRGPVPIKEDTVDRNSAGIPERYLHLKALSISGVYGGDTSASVVFTGSPNWSARAQRSDEVWVRVLSKPSMVRHYNIHVNSLYSSRYAHTGSSSSPGEDGLQRSVDGETVVPDWFDND